MFFKKTTFGAKKANLKTRQLIIRSIRAFFDGRDYDEVETPILQISPCMDTHIHAFKTKYKDVSLSDKQDFYLHTSPEFAMKKLLCAGCKRIYQICHVFRNADNTKLHSPEFTMLEWYEVGLSYFDMMDQTISLIRHIAKAAEIDSFKYKSAQCDPFKDWQKLTVNQAFSLYADINLDSYLENTDSFRQVLQDKGLHCAADDAWDDLFFRAMHEYVEPHLGYGVPTIFYDYPARLAALSRLKPENKKYAERYEVYICGVELANAFGELTDPDEQLKRFEHEMAQKKALYGEEYPIDYEFIAALKQGLPECSGIALGIDRLVMLATGASQISEVLWSELALENDV